MIDSINALSTVVIASATAILVWHTIKSSKQHQKNIKEQLRHNLFDYRYDVYSGVRIFINRVHSDPNKISDYLDKLLAATFEAEWFFEEDILKYLEKLREKGKELEAALTILKDLDPINTFDADVNNKNDMDQEFQLAKQQKRKTLDWFRQQFNERPYYPIFKEYLKIEDVIKNGDA